MNDDDELLARLGQAIDQPVPPVDPERVAAVRAAAQAAADSSATPAPVAPVAPLRSRRSILGLGALAAGSAAAGVAIGVGLTSFFEDDPVVPLEPVSDLEVAAGVTASASLIDHTWGLEVVLDVEGLEPGAPYRMVFVDRDGADVDAGGFVGTDGLMKCRNNGPILKADVSRWVVTDADGSEAISALVV